MPNVDKSDRHVYAISSARLRFLGPARSRGNERRPRRVSKGLVVTTVEPGLAARSPAQQAGVDGSACLFLAYPRRPDEDDAERAVRAGLALIDAMAAMLAVRSLRPQVRVGIATGLVVVGELIGVGSAQETRGRRRDIERGREDPGCRLSLIPVWWCQNWPIVSPASPSIT